LLRHALEELKPSPKDASGRGWQTPSEALESATTPLVCAKPLPKRWKRRYGRCDKAASFPFEIQLRIESSTPPASSAPGLSEKEGRRRARERQGGVCRVSCRDYEPRNIAADAITGQYLDGWSELCRRRGGILPRRAFGNLLQRPLVGARLFHFLPQCVQVVAGRDDREEQEQKAAEGYRELENRFRATAPPQPEVNPRANQQQPEQVEK
jgi:hypothetical protein